MDKIFEIFLQELRKSLSNIQLNSILMDNHLPQEPEFLRFRSNTKGIQRSVQRLEVYLQNLSDWIGLHSNSLSFQNAPLDSLQALHFHSTQIMNQAELRWVKILRETPSQLAHIDVDASQFNRVLDLLFEFAVHHCEENGSVLIRANENEDNTVGFSLEFPLNTPFTPAWIELVKNLFTDSSSKPIDTLIESFPSESYYGLSALIASEILKAMGGKLWVENEARKLSLCFSVKRSAIQKNQSIVTVPLFSTTEGNEQWALESLSRLTSHELTKPLPGNITPS